jgi:Choline/ethanolamine kinase
MWKIIEREQGYGSLFNNLYLLDDKIKKEAKNEYGITKIQKEIIFYKYVQKHKCLPMPKFLEELGTSYTMTYLPDYKPLYQVFQCFSENEKANILQQIDTYLQQLHKTETRIVSREVYQKNLYAEMIDKLQIRYEEVRDILNEYNFIKSVNGLLVHSFNENITRLQAAAIRFIESQNTYMFSPIHGDCQFNNILYNTEKKDLVFIDPRGYFGDHDIFGPVEYDFAKVKFALSGYDTFDAREVKHLDISGSNISLEIPTLIPQSLATNDFISQLVVSIWMGNAHCFKENKFKTAYSYFIAMYYASLYL